MTKPQFTLIPSAYRVNTVYSVLPVDGSGDMTFLRGSEATRVREDGLIENVLSNTPRLNWLNSNCPSLLLEPQRTNLIQYSEDFSNAYWVNNGVTINSNQIISPDGNLNADLLTGVSGGFGVVVFSKWSSTNNAASCFAKKGSSDIFRIANATGVIGGVNFDLDNGTVTNEDSGFNGQIENYGNGWFRCTAIDTLGRSGTFSLGVTAATESVYLWGAQLEEDYPTSYIATTSNPVSRSQDFCTDGGDSDLFDITEGTFFTDVTPYNSGNVTVIGLSIGNDTQRIIFQFQSNGTQVRVFSSGGVSFYANLTFDQRNKIAVTFKENEYKFFINGALVGSDTSATVPTGMDRLNFSNSVGTASGFEGEVHDTRVYNIVLTEAEAIKLTT